MNEAAWVRRGKHILPIPSRFVMPLERALATGWNFCAEIGRVGVDFCFKSEPAIHRRFCFVDRFLLCESGVLINTHP